MISNSAIFKMLGISEVVSMDEDSMISDVVVTFYPIKNRVSNNVFRFSNKLKASLIEIGVRVIPYEESWEKVPFRKRFNRLLKALINNFKYLFDLKFYSHSSNLYLDSNTIKSLCSKYNFKKKVTVIVTGEQREDELPMQYIKNFKSNSIVTIVDMPKDISRNSPFEHHFDTSMKLFAYHMTNIIIAISSNSWLIYNFNASHPVYQYPDSQFLNHLKHSLIPKLAAPINPHKLDEFEIQNERFDPNDEFHSFLIADMIQGSKLFSNTKLYPDGKNIEDLPFRKEFHKKIGRLHLDSRNGMSFGYIARQIPTIIEPAIKFDKSNIDYFNSFEHSDISTINNLNYIKITISEVSFLIKVPKVWVLTTRSGSNKTNLNPNKDIIKIGLESGKLKMQLPKDLMIDSSYKPSFDTKVILAHALGNVILAALLKKIGKCESYVNSICNYGYAICHWHGYFSRDRIPKNMISYGDTNPHVSCSSPQSAIYALRGKFDNIVKVVEFLEEYEGDIHIEPQHGINVCYKSVTDLATYIINNPECTSLGNKYI